jgi:hypothetical protein
LRNPAERGETVIDQLVADIPAAINSDLVFLICELLIQSGEIGADAPEILPDIVLLSSTNPRPGVEIDGKIDCAACGLSVFLRELQCAFRVLMAGPGFELGRTVIVMLEDDSD